MLKIQIQVFAALKDYFKSDFEIIASINTVHELKEELEKLNPRSKKVLQASRFAINENFVSQEYKLNENDKVVVLPPSSGG
jgi:molybdopterin synthase sulfur carrier subunit